MRAELGGRERCTPGQPEVPEGKKWLPSLCRSFGPHLAVPPAESKAATAREHGKCSCQAFSPAVIQSAGMRLTARRQLHPGVSFPGLGGVDRGSCYSAPAERTMRLCLFSFLTNIMNCVTDVPAVKSRFAFLLRSLLDHDACLSVDGHTCRCFLHVSKCWIVASMLFRVLHLCLFALLMLNFSSLCFSCLSL